MIDTSAWVQFFRSGAGPVSDEVARLVESDRAWITGPVIAELLHGTRSPKERDELATLLSTVAYAEVERRDWEAAGDRLRELRTKGLTVPLSDAVIASVAARLELAVLALDWHYDLLPARRWVPAEQERP
jgi:predicted nucleic acid-binding protein